MDFLQHVDSDDEADGSISVEEARINACFVECMQVKPSMKRGSEALHRKVALVGPHAECAPLQQRLRKAFADVSIAGAERSDEDRYDVVVDLARRVADPEPWLAPGGHYMFLSRGRGGDGDSILAAAFPEECWLTSRASRRPVAASLPRAPAGEGTDGEELVAVQRRAVRANPLGAVYWTAQGAYFDPARERSLLEEVTVAVSVAERREGVFSDASHARAVAALTTHGVVVFPGLFAPDAVLAWGTAAAADMAEALKVLRLRKGIDLLRPYVDGDSGAKESETFVENFHELSMREALRCDLRNGRHMTAHAAALAAPAPGAQPARGSPRDHAGLRAVLHEAMNPPALWDASATDARGNWGLWNFEGQGPAGGPPAGVAGQVGCVMSLPGCADQTIHADTPHLYVHTHLPPHYVNLFLPAAAAGSPRAACEVGQTAFVLGSHRLSTSAAVMVDEGGQRRLEEALVRPHLVAGDALLFDCRALHFGLANQHPHRPAPPPPFPATGATGAYDDPAWAQRDGWRPLLYVNFTQRFFIDPKNWDDRERLF